MKLKKIIGNQAHWTLNKVLVKELGLRNTLLLQHFIDLSENFFNGDEFYQQRERIMYELHLSEWDVKMALKELKDSGVIFVKRKGMPQKNYYKVNTEKVFSILKEEGLQQERRNPTDLLEVINSEEESSDKLVENYPTSEEDFSQQDGRNSTDQEKKQEQNKQEQNKQEQNNIKKELNNTNTGLIEKILDRITDSELDIKLYFEAIEDFNELGGLEYIASVLNWDSDIKRNWERRITNINTIRTM
jgi:ribosomal protein L9